MTSTPATTQPGSEDAGDDRSEGSKPAYDYRSPLPTRVSSACERCRRNKSRCDPFRPCSLCVRANVECSSSTSVTATTHPRKRRRVQDHTSDHSPHDHATPFRPREKEAIPDTRNTYVDTNTEVNIDAESRRHSVQDGEADSAMGIAQKICQLNSQHFLKRTVSAIPGGDVCSKPLVSRQDRTQRRPVPSILGYTLPPMDVMRTLLEEYFDAVHWFSLVIYEPRFRTRFQSIEDGLAYPSQKTFLVLLSVVLGMGAWYRSHKGGVDLYHPDEDWRAWGLSLITGAGSQLTDLMDHSSVASVQTCILLGSYYVYHGKPNLSFALLGATIKTAQAIGLHREPARGEFEDIEERKRVWWTIYTWDRFASVTYGRPLGINDKDCNVSTPSDVYEHPFFKQESMAGAESSICYSTYQRELNKLYMIASTIIETIFGIRTVGSIKQVTGNHYTSEIMEVTKRLWNWRQCLPAHLVLDNDHDYQQDSSPTSRVHSLQALALQLTLDNLLIIIHRPFLAQQVDHLFKNQPTNGQANAHPSLGTSHAVHSSSSSEQWWNAAVRTSKITEMPQLAQLATDSHLVAFLAINLFNSAIVMVVMALSDPLSDRAQEVKRTITRIFRLQELLGKRSTLSMQSNIVLKDVIHLLLRREAEAMLAPIIPSNRQTSRNSSLTSNSAFVSVDDTLRLPLQFPLNSTSEIPGHQEHTTADRVMRFNESLASVQRVFPNAFDSINNNDGDVSGGWEQGQVAPFHSSETGDGAWPNSDFHNFGIGDGTEPMNDELVDDAGNGLYWFWDSIWSEPLDQ